MYKILTRKIFMVTRFFALIIAVKAAFMTVMLASDTSAQNQSSGHNIEVTVSENDCSIAAVFATIESQTGLKFTIDENSLKRIMEKSVFLKKKRANLSEILLDLSKNANISFKRVNNYISVKKLSDQSWLSEEIENADVDISGKITDENGQSLPGASIIQNGTTNGATSDLEGNYKLSVPEGSVLTVSFVGYMSKEVLVGSEPIIDIQMEPDAEQLDEVVVIGYGTTTKRKLVGAVSSMDTRELEQTPFANVTQALQGQVPGIIVQSSGGGLGKVPDISIRGGGQPLFVIDGVVIDDNDNFSFASLNMQDIESISFLKDASSTAVYGSRAGNGIVLVKTKRGQSGKLNIKYSFNYQLSKPTVLPERIGTYEFAQVQNEAARYDGSPAFYTDEQLNTIRNGTDLSTYPNNNWYDLSLKNYAPEKRHNISLSGGNDQTNFFLSLGYFDQGGILKTDITSLKRYNIRTNVTTKYDNIGLEIGVNLNASLQNNNAPGRGEYFIWNGLARIAPTVPAFNEDGTIAAGVNHPLAQIYPGAGYQKQRDKYLNSQVTANWKIPGIKGLSTGLMLNYREGDFYRKTWLLTAPQYELDGSVYPVAKPSLEIQSGFDTKIDFIYNLSFAKNFGDHGLDATLAFTRIKSQGESVSASRRDYTSSVVDQIFAGPSLGQATNGSAFNSANEGYVGRFKYDFASRYIVEFSFRYDGNDNFAPSKRWGFFPAVSGAWIISDEAFMQNLYERNILTSLKLRASYGSTGLSEGAIRLGYLPVYNLEANAYNVSNSLVNGYSEGPLVDPNALTWFTRKSLNYGFDFGLLSNKLQGSFDYFYYKTSGYLQSPEVEYTTTLGKSLPQISSNSVQRRAGFELNLKYKKNVEDFNYEIGFNYSYFNQLWEQLDTEDEVTLKNPYIRVTHETDFYRRTAESDGGLYLSNGLFQSEEQIINSPRPLASTETQLGDIVYLDSNGDGKVDEQDRRRIGLPTFPHSSYGINFRLGYKGLSLSGLVQGTGDRYVAMGLGNQKSEAKDFSLKYQTDYWSPDNRDATFPRSTHTNGVNGGNQLLTSDYYILNAKYIRLKNIRLGYDLKSSLLQGLNSITACNVFVSGVNLLTVSDVTDFFDPEDVINEDNSINGYSGAAYPLQKTIALGINVSF